jgi:hypothetical protein
MFHVPVNWLDWLARVSSVLHGQDTDPLAVPL